MPSMSNRISVSVFFCVDVCECASVHILIIWAVPMGGGWLDLFEPSVNPISPPTRLYNPIRLYKNLFPLP